METFKGSVRRVAVHTLTPRRVAPELRKDAVSQRKEMLFDREGHLLEERFRKRQHINRITYVYNKRGKCVEQNEYNLEHNLFARYKYKYDRWGNQVEEQGFDAQGQLTHTLSHRYNAHGDELEKRLRRGESADRVEYLYDADGRLAEERRWKNGLFERSRSYRYDTRGNKVEETLTDSQGHAQSERMEYDYDEAGNILEERLVDGEGRTTARYTLRYDAAGRITQRTQVDHEGHFSCSHYHFDEQGRPLLQHWFNSASHSCGRLAYTYDEQGRLVQEELRTGGMVAQRQELLMEDGTVVQQVRYEGADMRLSYRHRHAYYPDGGRQDTWEEHYDGQGSLLQRAHRRYDTLGNLLQDTQNDTTLLYQYDAAGNWVQRTEQQSGETVQVVRREIAYYD